jgi:hypothetical protein
LWEVFYAGDRSVLAAQRCSRCGGALLWSPYIHDKPRQLGGKTRYPMGLSIYCRGSCDYMLGHLDGFAPTWALGITDWQAFNIELQSTNVACPRTTKNPA